jgi:sugar phosphate permease
MVAFFFLRFFGQGHLFNSSVTQINYWFVANRGKAMGLAGAIVSAMMLGIIPLVMIRSIDEFGWRGTYRALGLICLVVLVPTVAFFFREMPEAYGLLPDGVYPNNDDNDDNNKKEEAEVVTTTTTSNSSPSWSSSSAIRSPAFICYAASDLVIACTGTAFFFHLRSVYADSGVSDATVSGVYPAMAVISIVGRLSSGFLIDRIGVRLVMAGSLMATAVSMILIPTMTDQSALVIAFLLAFGTSAASNVRSCVHSSFFGRENLGRIQTVASSFTVLGSALGPFPFGLCRDVTGSFDLAFLLSAAVSIVAAILVMRFGGDPNNGSSSSSSSLASSDSEGTGGSVEMNEQYFTVDDDDDDEYDSEKTQALV